MERVPKTQFASRLLRWYDRHGRKDLPWQIRRTPYRVWVAEVMLQQTQVATVIPYFEQFIRHFPDVEQLAAADTDEVLHYWSGLGYYARGRNLLKTARLLVEQYQGRFPESVEALQALPGIGRSTAAAILAQAFGQQHAILDGNVKRVLARYFALPGWPGERKVSEQLWTYSEMLTPSKRVADYTQAIMDLGALVCTRRNPSCTECPVRNDCRAWLAQAVEAYPASRPARKLPVRSVQMLILLNSKGELLLQKRPPSGIWGGLLSFPEIPSEEDATLWCERYVGRVTRLQPRPSFQHTFSHFQLQIRPVHGKLVRLKAQVRDDTAWQWFRPGVSVAGLAAPVRSLITQLNG